MSEITNIDFEVYFKRQIDLWGLEKQKSLQDKKIAIVGAGGLGSSLAYALGSIGIGKIFIIDFDYIAVHNIHRQISFFINDVDNLKAIIGAERQKNRSPFSEIIPFVGSFNDFIKNMIDESEKLDLIFDATDNFNSRLEIDNFSKSKNIPWVYGAVEAFYGHFALIKNGNFNILKNLQQTPRGVSTPIVMNIASFQANLGLKYLLNEKILVDNLYIVSFDSFGSPILKNFQL